MSAARKALLVLGVLLGAGVGVMAAPPPKGEQITQWIRQLGDDNFEVREKASQQLWAAGKVAEPALTEAVGSADTEVRRRATEILDRFRWGIYPDTPADIVALIQRYQGGERTARQEVVQQLLTRGSAGCGVLIKLATAETDADLRRDLFLQISQDAARSFPALLVEDDFSTLEELLELSLTLDRDDHHLQNYAAYWLLRGKLDERIAHWKARADKDVALASAVLTFLYRARGDLNSSLQAAEKADRRDLVEMVLVEQGDWKALAKLADETAATDMPSLGRRAAYHRLAGDTVGLDRAVADILQVTENKDEDGAWLAAKMLLLNDRPREALQLLRKGSRAAAAFEILAAQMRFRDALALVEAVRKDEGPDAAALEILEARTLYLLGEKDRGKAIFQRLAEQVKAGKGGAWQLSLAEAEYRVGLREEAFDHFALVLAATPGEGNQETVFGMVFPDNGSRAALWWKFLRQRAPAEGTAVVLKRLREVMDPRTPAKRLQELAAGLDQEAAAWPPADREAALVAVAQTCLAAGQEEMGKDYLEKAVAVGSSAEPFLRLGDLLAGRKLWEQAAQRYGQAWEKDRKQPLPLYLKGYALVQSGAIKEGRRAQELAHWLPLGEEYLRQTFADELARRGQDEDASREYDLLVRTSVPNSFYAGEAIRVLAHEARMHKDFLVAADRQQRSVLTLLEPNAEFVDPAAYVEVTALVHRLRARGLLAANRLDDARKEMDACAALLPGHGSLPVLLVPELERRGYRKEANDLYRRVLDIQEKMCADYPGSAQAHNNLAWLCACCRRDLDRALEHARRAVALMPDEAGYLDTLAEIHFQRGDQDKAVELGKKCVALEGKSEYFRQQLRRFQAGDRNADIPVTTENDN